MLGTEVMCMYVITPVRMRVSFSLRMSDLGYIMYGLYCIIILGTRAWQEHYTACLSQLQLLHYHRNTSSLVVHIHTCRSSFSSTSCIIVDHYTPTNHTIVVFNNSDYKLPI